MMQASPDLAAASNRGTVTETARRSLIEAVAKAMALTAPVTKLLVLLAESRKLNYLPDLAAAYRERLLAHQNIVRAEVTSAAPLSPEKTKALEREPLQRDGQESGIVDERRPRAARRRGREDRQHGVRRQREDAARTVAQRVG